MAKKTDSTTRINAIVSALAQNNSGALSKNDLSYLQRYINSHAEFADWFRNNFGTTNVTVSRSSTRDAKDAYNTYGFTPTPQRGKTGQDTASMVMRSGMRTNQTGDWADVDLEKHEAGNNRGSRATYSATPVGGRTRTAGEVASIIKRGRSGATLNLEDQRIYDRYVAQQREDAIEKQRQQINQELAEKNEQEREAKFQYLGMEDDGSLNDLQIAELVSQREARNKTNEELYRQNLLAEQRAKQEAEAAAAKRRQQEVDNGRTPDMTDEDYAKWMQLGGSKFAKWGYNAEDQREVDAMDSNLKQKIRSGDLSQEDIDQLKKIVESAKQQWYKKEVQQKDNVPEGQPVISDDGQFYVSDGKWVPYTPKESADEKQARVAQEREEKRQQQLQDRREKWIDSRADKLMKEVVEDDDHPNGYNKYPDYDSALKQAELEARSRFGDYEKYGLDWDTTDPIPQSVREEMAKDEDTEVEGEEQDVWVFGDEGHTYADDVAHGYTGSEDDWLAEFGGGVPQAAAEPEPAGHMKNSYL